MRHEIALGFTRLRRSGARQKLSEQIRESEHLAVEADRMLADGWLRVGNNGNKGTAEAGNELCFFLTDLGIAYLESIGYWRDRYGWTHRKDRRDWLDPEQPGRSRSRAEKKIARLGTAAAAIVAHAEVRR